MTSANSEGHRLSVCQVVGRGFVAAHGVLIGAVCLAIVHLPLQITNALGQRMQTSGFTPGQPPDPERIGLALAVAGLTGLAGLVVFFVFPLIQGGILGQVRDRLQFPGQSAGSFGQYARSHYVRLLASQGLFLLISLAVIVPLVLVATALETQAIWALGEPIDQEPSPWALWLHPVMLAVMFVAITVLTVAGMVYWMANCVVVAEREGMLRSWARGFNFCRRNLWPVTTVWLLNLVVGLLFAPLGMLCQFGIIVPGWAVVVIALVSAAATGYWGLVLAGLCMSVYLNRRPSPSYPSQSNSIDDGG